MTGRLISASLAVAVALALVVVALLGFEASAAAQDAAGRVVRESTEIEQLRPWIVTLFSGLSLAFAIWTFSRQTKKSEFKEITEASEEKLTELKDRFDKFASNIAVRESGHADKLNGVSERLRSVEERLLLAPTAEDLHLLALKIAEVMGDIKAMASDMRALSRSSERIDGMMQKDRA